MFKGFQNIDDYRSRMFRGVPSNISDQKKSGGLRAPFAWLDAGNTSCITKDDNDLISSFHDKNGGSFAFTQAIEIKRPLLLQNAINGRAAVLLNNGLAFLENSILSKYQTFFIVFNSDEDIFAAYRGLLVDDPSATYNRYMLISQIGGTLLQNNPSSSLIANNCFINAIKTKDCAPLRDAKILYCFAQSVFTSNNMGLGRAVDGHTGWLGGVAEILLFDRLLNDYERKYYHNYLSVKYNIPLS